MHLLFLTPKKRLLAHLWISTIRKRKVKRRVHQLDISVHLLLAPHYLTIHHFPLILRPKKGKIFLLYSAANYDPRVMA